MVNDIIDNIIINALKEDMPNGDVTVDNLIPIDEISDAKLIAKDCGVISGIEVFKRVFEILDKDVNFETELVVATHSKDNDQNFYEILIDHLRKQFF